MILHCDAGCSGAPIVIVNDGKMLGSPEGYSLAGIVSFANVSSLQDSGIGCISISSIQDWINDVTSQQVPIYNYGCY